MFKIKKRYIFFFSIIVFVILMQFKIPESKRYVRGILGNMLNPFLYLFDNAKDFVSDAVDNYFILVGIKQENKKLKEEVEILKLEKLKLLEKVNELERLKKLLNFKEAYQFDTIACNVIGRNIKGLIRYIIIDRGAEDGVEIDLPVINSQGLVGKVTEVYLHTAKVKVLLDSTLKVSVLNFRTRDTGVVSGTDMGLLKVDYYPNIADIREGDLFITSGLGMLYPKGLPIGVVVKYNKADFGLFKNVVLKPLVEFNKLENVLVVLKNEKE